MSRVQLALNVADIDAAVEFYSKLFGARTGQASPRLCQLRHRVPAAEAGPHRDCRRPAPTGVTGALNHLGVEVDADEEVQAATRRLADAGPGSRRPGVHHLLLRRPGQGVGERPRRGAMGGLHRPRRRP